MPNVLRLAVLALLVLFLPAGTPGAQSIKSVERVVSPGGIEAWLIEDRTTPVISVNFAFTGAGSVADPADRPGLSRFLAAMLDEGAGPLDETAFGQKLEDLAISLGFDAGRDNFNGSLTSTRANSEAAFALLELALNAPRLDPDPMARVRAALKVSIVRAEEDPDDLARQALYEKLFAGHPYARRPEGTLQSVEAIAAAELRGFKTDFLTRDRLLVGVSGDIDAERLGPMLDRVFGKLPASGKPSSVAPVVVRTDGSVRVVPKAVPQSTALLAQSGIERNDPDFFPAYVMNYILGGGGFSSRLLEEVRRKRGLAYSTWSYLIDMDHATMILAGVATNNEQIAESLRVIRDEWRRMAEDGPTAEELAHAKSYLTGSFPLRFSSNSRMARMLVSMQIDDLGIDYLARRNSYVEAVTLEDVRRVARELLKPEALTAVVVGTPRDIGL